MKRAFTLIELLVVIAIIAILAAILFPVFAQAKLAAKKTAAISNQKQISLGIMMYTGDSDDIYPRNDDCQLGSALNPKFQAAAFNGSGPATCAFPVTGGGTGSWNRMNHYTWQKWVLPYIKSTDLFFHPVRGKNDRAWNEDGQIMGSYGLNLALTGALDTYNKDASTANRAFRNSFIGGNQSAIPNVSASLLLFDINILPLNSTTGIPVQNFAPGLIENSKYVGNSVTLYPLAVREFWATQLMKPSGAAFTGSMSGVSNQANEKNVTAGGVVIGFADGSAKWMPVGKFLSNTPLQAEYMGISTGGATTTGNIGSSSAVQASSDLPANIGNLNYPMWALGQ